ncbi:MAG: DUF1501 domain-containing protein [Paracoccus sp. (in: a-proteobacteria)]
MLIDRRRFLNAALGGACSLAAMPGLTRMSFASAPGERRFVAIVLRGAMDGLDVVQPYGDPMLRQVRKTLSAGPEAGALDLDGFYALHPMLAPLLPMWQAGELGVAQAVSTPYRDKRSHFDGQDILEAGTNDKPEAGPSASGWLNRMLPMIPGAVFETGFAVGSDELTILNGPNQHAQWAPDSLLSLSPQAQILLQDLYESDPPFHEASEAAIRLSARGDTAMSPEAEALRGPASLASFAAVRLNGDTRIAAFSMSGWDTHRSQLKVIGQPMVQLAETLEVLKRDLGRNWDNTVVMAMTEFGRTVRENGTAGTDHGTGGLLVMAGGAVRGRQVFGKWPGLDEGDLYAGRDLMPTADVRAYAGAALSGLFGVPQSGLESTIFPGLQIDEMPGILR